MTTQEALAEIAAYIDPVDEDISRALYVVKSDIQQLIKDYESELDEQIKLGIKIKELEAEVERKDKALHNVVDTYKMCHGGATDLHINMEETFEVCRQALPGDGVKHETGN